jgi:flagellar basal body-associated protein FliL
MAKVKTKAVKCTVGNRKKILAILVMLVLLILSFTLSSCKSCDKDKDENKADDPITTKASVDGDENQDSPTIDAIDANESNSESAPAFDALDELALSEVAQHIRARGAGNAEIKATVNIGRGGFGEGIGSIVRKNGHFTYRNANGTPYEGQTHYNCGLYAMKRFLFVLGRHGLVDKNLWYEYTDQELRDKLAEMPKGARLKSQGEPICARYLKTLMKDIKIPIGYCSKIYDYDLHSDICFIAPFLTSEEKEFIVAKINREVPAMESKVRNILRRAQNAEAEAEIEMKKVRVTLDAKIKNTVKENVINAARVAQDAASEAKALLDEVLTAHKTLSDNLGYGGWELPDEIMIEVENATTQAREKTRETTDAARWAKKLAEEAAKF